MLAIVIGGMSSGAVLEMVSKRRGVCLAVAYTDGFSKEPLAISVSVHTLKFGGDKHRSMGFINGIPTRGASLDVTEIASQALTYPLGAAIADKNHLRGRS